MADDQVQGAGSSAAGSKGKSRFEEFGRKIDERVGDAVPRAEDEVKKVIAYLNDEVVPQIRQNSSQALKIAAEQLSKLAERLDRSRGGDH